jgi:hypothetical protein
MEGLGNSMLVGAVVRYDVLAISDTLLSTHGIQTLGRPHEN